MGLPNSKQCEYARDRAVKNTGGEKWERERDQRAALWTIAGHLARLSQALGQDPEPPRATHEFTEEEVPF